MQEQLAVAAIHEEALPATDLAVRLSQTGLNLATENITTDGKKFINNGKVIIYIDNQSGGARTITVQTPAVVEGDLTVQERTISVPDTEQRYIGKLTPSTYNQPSGADAGMVYVDADTATSVSIAAIQP